MEDLEGALREDMGVRETENERKGKKGKVRSDSKER